MPATKKQSTTARKPGSGLTSAQRDAAKKAIAANGGIPARSGKTSAGFKIGAKQFSGMADLAASEPVLFGNRAKVATLVPLGSNGKPLTGPAAEKSRGAFMAHWRNIATAL